MKSGKIITLSGVTGVGKSFITSHIINSIDNFKVLKSATTRGKRQGEIEGIDKYFLSKEEFEMQYQSNQFSVVNKVFDNVYAFYKKDIELCNLGINLITDLHYTYIADLKKKYPNTISIYIYPKNLYRCIEMIKTRCESSEELEKRSLDMKRQLKDIENNSNVFDIIFTNNYDDESINKILEIIRKKL